MIDPWDHPIFGQTLQEWQGIVDLVARVADVRAGLVMRVRDDDIEVFVSSRSAGNPYEVGDKEKLCGSGLYCERVIATQEQLLVPNALKSDEWRNNPDIKLNMISYLGFPIRLASGRPFGTICVLDDREHEYGPDVIALLEKMRDLIENHLQLNERLLLREENCRLLEQLQGELAERTRGEEALRASEERYRMLLALSPDGISVTDITGRILACNEQFVQVHGYGHSSELIGRCAREFTTPEAYDRLYREVATAFERGERVARGMEVEVARPDGSVLVTEYSVAQIPWADAPAGVAFVANIRDVTERNRMLAELTRHQSHLEEQVRARTRDLEAEIARRTAAQAALARSERILNDAERIAHVGSWERDLITGDLYWSDETHRIFGISSGTPPEDVRKDIWGAVYPEDYRTVEAAYAHMLQTGVPFNSVYRIILPGGELRVVHH